MHKLFWASIRDFHAHGSKHYRHSIPRIFASRGITEQKKPALKSQLSLRQEILRYEVGIHSHPEKCYLLHLQATPERPSSDRRAVLHWLRLQGYCYKQSAKSVYLIIMTGSFTNKLTAGKHGMWRTVNNKIMMTKSRTKGRVVEELD